MPSMDARSPALRSPLSPKNQSPSLLSSTLCRLTFYHPITHCSILYRLMSCQSLLTG
ncbi:MAG: hypothetical protein F6K09_24875 [Merismopedia sp. SIO2A8]|nr:hypothetical protein [Symploca sp. SIO2B6]NET51814.1 hypothetical protein [Merismopedia sp. SIO2A8]